MKERFQTLLGMDATSVEVVEILPVQEMSPIGTEGGDIGQMDEKKTASEKPVDSQLAFLGGLAVALAILAIILAVFASVMGA